MMVVDGDGNALTMGLEPPEVSDQAKQVAQRIADRHGEPVWLVREWHEGGDDDPGERFDPAEVTS